MDDILPTLYDLGGPEKFASWRAQQIDAIQRAINSDKRFNALCLPTGAGKSAIGVGIGILAGVRAVYLCSTKGQMDQVYRDFGPLGLVDIRGMDNYQCVESQSFGSANTTSVAAAPCHAGVTCPSKESTCTYYGALREARKAKLVVTNYPYWIYQNLYGDGIGQFDLMVCDEVHELGEALSSALSTAIQKYEVEAILNSTFPHVHAGQEHWKKWALALGNKLVHEIADMREQVKTLIAEGEYAQAHHLNKRLRERKDLERRLNTLAGMKGEWVAELHGTEMRWDAVQVGEYAEQMLFWHVPKVLLMSATLRPKTLELLGVPPTAYNFLEYPSTFPLKRRPIYRIPTVRLNKDSTEEDYRTWVTRIDQIIRPRLDRKGIVHTVSYARAKVLLEKSEYREHMISHTSKNTNAVVESFRKSKPPLILVSPSVDTGYDFPASEARWMVVGKLPYPDSRSAVMKARREKDDTYLAYLTAQSLVQMCGRAVRSEDDWAEIFCIDDNLNWFVARYRAFMPKWFLDAIHWVNVLPEPMQL